MILSCCPNPSIDTYAWLHSFKAGGVNRISRLREFPGGKGIHVALALAELGADSKLLGLWAGNNGQWIKQACEEKGVASSGVGIPGNNRKCFSFRSEDPTFDNSELLEPGPELSFDAWEEFKHLFATEITNASLVCMSGSWPAQAPADAYRSLIRTAKQQQVKTLLDCTGTQLEQALEEGFFGLHLNEEEAENLCGSRQLQALLHKLAGRVELVALTKGAEGLDLYYKGEIVTAKVPIENIVSTVGSGDCLTAGIAFAVEKDWPLEKIAAYGVACGAANCLTEDLGMLQREQVEELLPRVQLKKIRNEY